MLYAFKHELTHRTARQIISVREHELRFYTRNISNIGSQAALLAGFAFTAIVAHSSEDMLEWVEEYAPEETFAMLHSHIAKLDHAQLAMTAFELLYLLSTISAMGSTLYTLYICLVTPILGLGLALRGNEGSVDRAVLNLAGVNAAVIREFGTALRLFQFSVLIKAFMTYHLLAACACSVSVLYYAYAIRSSEKRIVASFAIPRGAIVTGRFDDAPPATHWSPAHKKRGLAAFLAAPGRSGGGGGLQARAQQRQRSPPPRKRDLTVNQMNAHDPYTSERRDRRRGLQLADPEMEKPANVARQMMYRVQGPLPPDNPVDRLARDDGILPQLTGI